MTNTVNISRLLQDYIDALGVVQKELQEHDSASLYTFFDGARAYRDSFIDAGSGPIKKDYSIRLDIPDEAGSIAAVSTLLALNNISIKNIIGIRMTQRIPHRIFFWLRRCSSFWYSMILR